MIVPETEFPKGKKTVFYGVGAYAADFVKKHCLKGCRLPLPDYFCDDRLGDPDAEYFGRPLRKWETILAEHPSDQLVVVVLALASGNLAIPGRNAREWDFADIRIGRCLDMRFEIEDRKASGDCRGARRLWADEDSRLVFDFMTENIADGAIWCRKVFEPNPYFGNDVITEVGAGEVYIDAGANLGEDMIRLAALQPDYGRMVGFEPDARVFDTLNRAFSDPRVETRRQGLADRWGRAAFDASGACGRLAEDGAADSVEIVRLDDCGVDGVSLIKMDVEGGEAAALAGGAQIIAVQRPRLAISAYHKASDLFELPKIILNIRPDYRLYLRQHSVYTAGTVLYAV